MSIIPSIIGNKTEAQLRELLLEYGIDQEDINSAVRDIERYLLAGYGGAGVKAGLDRILELINSPNILPDIVQRYSTYKKSLQRIRDSYQETKDWDSVITTVVYVDDKQSQEAFIDLVEEIYQVKILSAEQLRDLTGITKESLEGLEETLQNSRISRYKRGLSQLIRTGGSYQDLLSLDPGRYQLPVSMQGEIIRAVLIREYGLNEISYTSLLPDIRTVAEDLKAPYSVLLEALLIAQQ